MSKIQTPYRYDFVGSFLRPQALKEAKSAYQNGELPKEEFDKIVDEEVSKVVAKQKELGFHVITDGEFRRSFWHLDFMWGFDGVAHENTGNGVKFDAELAVLDDTYLVGKIKAKPHPFVEGFRFLKQFEDENCIARQTMPAPAQLLAELYREDNGKNTDAVYPDHEQLLQDIAAAYRTVIRDLYARKLLDAEMPAITTNDMRSKWAASQAVISYQSWNGCETCIAALRQLSPDMEYVVLPLLQDEGGKVHAQVKYGVTAYGAIPVTSKHAKEAIQAINSMIQIDNFTEIVLGEKDVHYTVNEDGTFSPIQPAFNNDKVASNVFVSGFYREVEYPKMWEVRLAKNADLQSTFYAMRDSLLDGGERSPVALAPAVTVVDNKAALENRITDTLIAVICGTSDISELDTLREYWHKNGGEEIIEFYNTWYAENVAK